MGAARGDYAPAAAAARAAASSARAAAAAARACAVPQASAALVAAAAACDAAEAQLLARSSSDGLALRGHARREAVAQAELRMQAAAEAATGEWPRSGGEVAAKLENKRRMVESDNGGTLLEQDEGKGVDGKDAEASGEVDKCEGGRRAVPLMVWG